MKVEPINLGDTQNLTNEEWLEWRKHGPSYKNPNSPNYLPITLGGSDVAAVFDVSPWKSSYELFHQKSGTQKAVNRVVNATSKELGHIYEDAVSEVFLYWFRTNYPNRRIIKVNDTNMYQCGKRGADGTLLYPWAVGNLDRRIWIDGLEGVLEIKTTSHRNYETIAEWRSGIVPIYYELQCRFYMAIMDVNYCYICCAWGLGIDEMAVVRIDRDLSIEDEIMEKCRDFVECVEQAFEPDPADCKAELINQFYYELYGEVDPKAPFIELPEKYRDVILSAMEIENRVKQRKAALKEAESEREQIYSQLYPVFGRSTSGSFKLNESQVVYLRLKTPMTRAKLDSEKLAAEHPELLKEYGVTTFDSKKLKEEMPELYKEYLIPSAPSKEPGVKNSFSLDLKELKTT